MCLKDMTSRQDIRYGNHVTFKGGKVKGLLVHVADRGLKHPCKNMRIKVVDSSHLSQTVGQPCGHSLLASSPSARGLRPLGYVLELEHVEQEVHTRARTNASSRGWRLLAPLAKARVPVRKAIWRWGRGLLMHASQRRARPKRRARDFRQCGPRNCRRCGWIDGSLAGGSAFGGNLTTAL